MRWTYGRESNNVEDARGGGGIGGPAMIGGGGIGIAVLALVAMFFGVDPRVVLNGVGGGGQDAGYQQPAQPAQDAGPHGEQVRVRPPSSWRSTEDVWGDLFRQMSAQLRAAEAGAVLRRRAVGLRHRPVGHWARSTARPTSKVYLDLAFFERAAAALRRARRLRAGLRDRPRGRPPRAEPARHHATRSSAARPQAGQAQANALSVRVELQADCFAGVWAHHAQRERASSSSPATSRRRSNAAAPIGDDRLQKQARGYVVPDSFTHGTSAQRVRWFRRGIESGDIGQCNTFGAAQL